MQDFLRTGGFMFKFDLLALQCFFPLCGGHHGGFLLVYTGGQGVPLCWSSPAGAEQARGHRL